MIPYELRSTPYTVIQPFLCSPSIARGTCTNYIRVFMPLSFCIDIVTRMIKCIIEIPSVAVHSYVCLMINAYQAKHF